MFASWWGFFFGGGGEGGVLKESLYSFSSLHMAHVSAWGTVCVYACMYVWVGGCFEAQVAMRFYPPAGGVLSNVSVIVWFCPDLLGIVLCLSV